MHQQGWYNRYMTNNNPDARARLIELTTNSPDLIRATEPPYYSTIADIASEMLRDLLMIDDDDALDATILNIDFDLDYYRDNSPAELDPADDADLDVDALANELIDLLALLRTDPYSIHFLSLLRLEYSICPMHHCDYCACFDDDDPECATIRDFFPNHDT